MLPGWMPLSVFVWSVSMLIYHGLGLLFEWSDRRNWLRRFKQRRGDRRSYGQLLPLVLFNQCCVMLPCMVACEALGLAFVGPPHLGPIRICVNLALLAIGHDIVAYVLHRGLLHNPRFRWLRHDVHHSTGASKSISACFMSPVDFFLEIVCPFLIPLILIGGGGSDLTFHLLGATLAPIGGLYEHSGYDFCARGREAAASRISRCLAWLPLSLSSSHAHGEHHRRSCVSFSDGFGSPGLCDWLFATRWDLR